ncbi:DUF5317 domain-containing protein [Cohnella nanjingensis]|uniref:DUF5317 domain-containing protein n=1 Tax=Cohnella nanjingensis TaxID=1387779 RepID=A0A7X0VIG1_9BACL|nr:DUF5317 domain-containing protein [Cohnella nanjingensis]MBB6673629.1 DUF5317 domain-containing protein [Cohnella nanjingensis]
MVYDGIVIGLIIGLLRAGWRPGLVALSQIRIRGGWIFPALLAVQLIVFSIQDRVSFVGQYSGWLFMAVYVVGLYVLWLNRKESGIWIIFIGVAMNFLVMLVNGGRMPVSLDAAAVLDPIYTQMLKDGVGAAKHYALDDSTRLSFLGDIIPIAPPYPRTQVISIGDVVMNVGIFLYLQSVMLKNKVRASFVQTK